MSYHVIIPARYGSERFPGKPLADLNGKTMIQRVYERAVTSAASSVTVATDDNRIEAEVNRFGGAVVMTRADHPSGTDRLHEAAQILGLASDDVVVNVQGDEPLIPMQAINLVASLIKPSVRMATLCEKIENISDVLDPNIVKVVRGEGNQALYFSRAPVPWDRQHFSSTPSELPQAGTWWRHLGIYAYNVSLLDDFVSWPEGSLEKTERLEQLRVMEKGVSIHIEESPVPIPPGIDTPDDLVKALKYIED